MLARHDEQRARLVIFKSVAALWTPGFAKVHQLGDTNLNAGYTGPRRVPNLAVYVGKCPIRLSPEVCFSMTRCDLNINYLSDNILTTDYPAELYAEKSIS